jgi:hypothetical protein
MLTRLASTFSLIILLGFKLSAQNYGFEWIKPYQPYFKFKVAQTGVFRINNSTLTAAGINLTGLHPKRFQVFRNGVETPIFVHGQQDGNMDAGDYIEFFAEKNDGKLDSLLYANPNWQPHSFVSLFGDTAVYFLTVLPDTSTSVGLRYTQTNNGDFGTYTPETYLLQDVNEFPTEEYLYGIDLAGASSEVRYYQSDFTEGEGWASTRLGAGLQRNYTLSTPFKFVGGPAPTVEIKVIGASNASNVAINHHVQILLGSDISPLAVIADQTFSAYQVIKFTPAITQSQIGNTSAIFGMKVVNDLGAAADFNSLSYIKLTYARQYLLGTSTRLGFRVVHQQGALKSRLNFSGYGTGTATNPIVYDLTAKQRLFASYAAQTVNALVDNDGKPHQLFLCDSAEITDVSLLLPVVFKPIDPQDNHEFIIVGHELLNDAMNEYATYREQKFNILKVTSSQLYDYYSYGNPHPLSIKRLASHLLKEAPVAPRYLLLAGRGYQADLLRNPSNYNSNLVPALGVPSSDALFTSGINGAGNYAEIATGRVAATSNADLKNYLDKLIDYETASDSILPWRKNVVHVTGGDSYNEQLSFINQFKVNEQTIRGKYFGASVQTFSKNNSEPQQIDLRDKILAAQNAGTSLFSFYGHASLTVLDVDIGNITDLNNPRKYPLYYFSGCNVGNANAEDPANTGDVYAKTYLCTANKGAIGWLAHTNFSYTGNLNALQNSFYEKITNSYYGSSIGTIIQQVTKGITSNDPITRSHSIQWLYQGDPATVIYSPALPDYKLTSQDMFVTPANASTQLDSFTLAIIVSNIAKAIDDSITITISRKLPNNATISYGPTKFKGVYFKDTVYLKMPSSDAAMVGNNVFDVTVNKFLGPVESNVFNNTASYTFFLPGQGLQSLSPLPYAIISSDTVELVAQSNDLFATSNEFVFELDTTPAFNSPSFKTSGNVQSKALATWKPVLTANDTQAFYWRVRLNVPINQGGAWNTQSFTYVPSGTEGWMQTGFYQYTIGGSSSDLLYDSTNQQLKFEPDFNDVLIKTARWRHGGLGVLDPMPLNPQVGTCIGGGIVCILYGQNTVVPFVNPRFTRNCSAALTFDHKYYAFDTRTLAGQDEFIRFVDSADVGTYFAIYSYYESGSQNWTPAFRAKLSSLGSQKSANIANFYSAFTMMGQKGAAPGTIVEDTIYNNQFNSPNAGDTIINAQSPVLLEGKWFTGSLVSDRIGPVKKWKSFGFNFKQLEQNASDKNSVSVYAVRENGTDSLVQNATQTGSYSLASLSAEAYPYLKLKVVFTDTATRTPNQFGYWKVDFDAPTEGTLLVDDQFLFYNKTIEQGDSVKIKVTFKNVSSTLYDSVPVEYKILAEDRTVKYTSTEQYGALAASQQMVFNRTLPSVMLSGKNQLIVTVNKEGVIPEVTTVNNVISQWFDVKTDTKNPLMDVTFDGYRIMNGDFVSPVPVISIISKDENNFRLQTDTATFTVYLKRPSSNDYERISMTDNRVVFHPASAGNNKAYLEFKPERLSDGIYKLKVLSKDASGNASGANAYEVEFNVINESTITNFFPYPNPFTTNMRFVFTLTGATPPDDLLIRIMTITGKVVKEVSKDEFGPIKIGNNVSEFAWDGTDNFGDRLANGVYLYQVLTRINGDGIKKRDTAADKFITHSTGKIYMLK